MGAKGFREPKNPAAAKTTKPAAVLGSGVELAGAPVTGVLKVSAKAGSFELLAFSPMQHLACPARLLMLIVSVKLLVLFSVPVATLLQLPTRPSENKYDAPVFGVPVIDAVALNAPPRPEKNA